MTTKKAATRMSAVPDNGAPPSPLTFGQVPPEIVGAVAGMRERSNQLIMELGRMELRRSAIVDELQHMERQTRSMLREEAKRMGIPEGVNWQMTPDGTALAAEG